MNENKNNYEGLTEEKIERINYLINNLSILEILKREFFDVDIIELDNNKFLIQFPNEDIIIKLVIDDNLNNFNVYFVENEKEELKHRNLNIFTYKQLNLNFKNNLEILRCLEDFYEDVRLRRQSPEDIEKINTYFNNRGISNKVIQEIRPYLEKKNEEKIVLFSDYDDVIYKINVKDNSLEIPNEDKHVTYDSDVVTPIKKGWNYWYIFNNDSQDNNLYICENIWDTLKLESLNKKAISVDTINSLKTFFNLVDIADVSNFNFILCFKDNEENKKNVAELLNSFKSTRHKHVIKELYIPEKYENINQWYNEDKEIFDITFNSLSNDNMFLYLKNSFKQDIKISSEYGNVSTGFKNWDKIINGIRPSLYVIGAIPSLGKTTLMHQMCDNLAKSGQKVLFFSLEQTKLELTAKSLSRLTYTSNELVKIPKNTLQIMQNVGFTHDVKKAMEEYIKFAENICIIDGEYDTTIQKIKNYIEDYIRCTKEHPVVVIDYLQIINPVDDKQAERQNIDDNVKILKELSKEYKLPIFVICSVSRAYYDKPIDMIAFKESGGIEYGADVLMGLQLQKVHELDGVGNKSELLSMAKSEKPRKLELVILKNRNGMSYANCHFNYYAEYNYFEEVELLTDENTNTQNGRGFDLKDKNK